MMKGKFDFGSSDFDDKDLTYLSSTGHPSDINTKMFDNLLVKIENFLHSFDAMKNFDESLGSFIQEQFETMWIRLGEDKAGISWEMKEQMLDFAEKGVLATEAAGSWLEISAKLTASSGEAEGNDYHTWKTEGYKTVFDFITVS